TYADASISSLIDGVLLGAIKGQNAFDIPACWMAMWRVVRNLGRSGLAASAISAVDTSLWDLKARAVGLPLASLLGRCSDRVQVYGSGGFTSYSDDQLCAQLARWPSVSASCRRRWRDRARFRSPQWSTKNFMAAPARDIDMPNCRQCGRPGVAVLLHSMP